MKISAAKLTPLCVVCLMFFFFANTVSFGKIMEIVDSPTTIQDFRAIAEDGWPDGNPDVRPKMNSHDGWGDRWSLLLETAEYNTKNNRKWGIEVRENPQADNEYRYFTIAWKADPRNKALMFQFHAFWGFGCVHEDFCWDHRWYAGNVNAIAPILKNPADGGNVQKFELPEGSYSNDWTFIIIDLFDAADGVIHARPLKILRGEWTINAIALDTDNPFPKKGMALFDAIYFTQTRAEAEAIEESRAVSPADKVTTTWGSIKAQD